MRQLKFRAWDGENNTWCSAEQIEKIICNPQIKGAYFELDHLKSNGLAESIPFDVMQFTGLTDKNGVEIYEGDIDKKFGVVKWLQDCCEYVFENEEGFISLTKNFCEDESEVIGNIYEHQNQPA